MKKRVHASLSISSTVIFASVRGSASSQKSEAAQNKFI